MKPFERSVPTVGALLASNSSPLERMRWGPRWATNRFAEYWVVRAVFGGEPPPSKTHGTLLTNHQNGITGLLPHHPILADCREVSCVMRCGTP